MAVLLCLLFILTLQSKAVIGFRANLTSEVQIAANTTERNGKLSTPEASFRADLTMNVNSTCCSDAISEKHNCEYLDITGNKELRNIKEMREVDKEAYSFFVRPKDSFGRLVIQMRLRSALKIDEAFYTDNSIELRKKDFQNQGNEWVKVTVQYNRKLSRGPDSHGLRVIVGNIIHFIDTSHWRLLYSYEGFLLSAEGGIELLFNCSPEDYFRNDPSESSSWTWVIVGCIILTLLMLTILGCLFIHFRKRELSQESSSSPDSHVYEEFDEDMLARIREKVEALREGRCEIKKDPANQNAEIEENHYVIQMVPPPHRHVVTEILVRQEEVDRERDFCLRDDQFAQNQNSEEAAITRDNYSGENHYENLLDNVSHMNREHTQSEEREGSFSTQEHSPSNGMAGHEAPEENPYVNIYFVKKQ